jgi:hypothetical protein
VDRRWRDAVTYALGCATRTVMQPRSSPIRVRRSDRWVPVSHRSARVISTIGASGLLDAVSSLSLQQSQVASGPRVRRTRQGKTNELAK